MTDFHRSPIPFGSGTTERIFPRHFRLSATSGAGSRRLVISTREPVALAEQGGKPVNVARTGTFFDRRYGEFEITRTLLAEMVRNFNARVYGQDIFIDVAHRPDEGAAGKITRLWVDGDRLLADVEWTPFGRQAITERGLSYLSAEYDENWTDNETRQPHGAVLFGAGLTIRPVIKRLNPVTLSEPFGIHFSIASQLIDEVEQTMNKHLQALLKRLSEQQPTLAKTVIDQLGDAFEKSAKVLGDDEAALTTLVDQLADTGKKLAETLGEKPATINLSISPPQTSGKLLSEDDVRKLLADDRQREADAVAATAKTLAERKTQFEKLTADHASIKALSEEARAQLLAVDDLITATTTPAQVESIAKHVIALAEQMTVSMKLAGMGYPVHGSTRISVDDRNTPLKLQETINGYLRTGMSHAHLRLLDEKDLKPAVRKILAEFDRANAYALAHEAKLLDQAHKNLADPVFRFFERMSPRPIQLADGGATTVSNLNVPAGFQRTVIREALSDLNVLDLVQVLTDPSAQATTNIPYELRKPGTIVNNGIVYEGQGIPRASIEQKMDAAYINKMALSMLISNEVAFFSQSSLIDWDAYARNVDSNARLMRELVALRIANGMQRAADSYGATTRTAESVTAQLNGSNSLLKTAYWPIVRPKQVRDLQGNAIGSAVNPITVTINTVARSEFDGTGNQAAGIYWKIENANLGFIRLVDQTGAATGPANTGTNTITYASSNNVVKFDLKIPSGVELEDHLNGALRAIGAQKAMMSGDRYIMPDFQLMSPVLNDTLTNARQFAADSARAGSGLSGTGDLATVKGIPAFGTNAPGIDLGDERIILGQRGTLSYVVAKTFATGQPFEAVNSSGLPTGERIAYGEEYNAIHVPTPIQNRLTSVICYDSDARTAAV